MKRRNLTKGQQAMALAMIYPEAEKGRGKNAAVRKAVATTGFSLDRLTRARQVLAFSLPLADSVFNVIDTLDEALRKVEAERIQAEGNDALAFERPRPHNDFAPPPASANHSYIRRRPLALAGEQTTSRDLIPQSPSASFSH